MGLAQQRRRQSAHAAHIRRAAPHGDRRRMPQNFRFRRLHRGLAPRERADEQTSQFFEARVSSVNDKPLRSETHHVREVPFRIAKRTYIVRDVPLREDAVSHACF